MGAGGAATSSAPSCPPPEQPFTVPYPRRTIANWVAFLEHVEAWLDPASIASTPFSTTLQAHRALDVLLWALAHPRWEFVFQPKSAAYLNLIEPWWKMLRSLALKGRRFATWEEVCQAVAAATLYWNEPSPSLPSGAVASAVAPPGRPASPASR